MSGISLNPLLSITESTAEVNTIYVSPDGNDSNSGTEENPLQTLEAAKEAVRILSDGTKDIEVITSRR